MHTHTNEFTWKIGGEAGFGIMSTGEMFARVCMRAGLHVFDYPEYPSLVRGGHNTVQVTASTNPVAAHRTGIQILIALNRETINKHVQECTPRAVILYDTSDRTFKDFDATSVGRSDVQLIGLPLEELAKKAGGQLLMRNTVALGASCALLDIKEKLLADVVRHMFSAKGEKIVVLNEQVLLAGYDAISPEQRQAFPLSVSLVAHETPQVLLTGNDALSLGTLQAGCALFSAYPMTPASSILHFLAEHGPSYGLLVRHAEDEIAAIHHAIGAAYTGVRAMTATSGGGFSLMTEAVGMAAMTEVGIVIVNAQRGGPSTGLPTWTEQADLRQVLHASQGDFPRIVLAPSSHVECYTMIQHAFNLAETYQTPVIVLTDKYLAEGHRNVPISMLRAIPIERGKFEQDVEISGKEFARYRVDAEDGIAPRTLPGTPGGIFLANSDEHDEIGFSNEEAAMRIAQMDRRARKTTTLEQHMLPPRVIGPADAELTIVTWGSSAGPAEDALVILEREFKKKANVVIPTMIAPFPSQEFTAMMKKGNRRVIVEGNKTGQLAGWIREKTGVTFDHAINRYDGRPHDPAALATAFAALLRQA